MENFNYDLAFIIVFLLTYTILFIWIYKDARKLKLQPMVWAIITCLMPFMSGLIIYIFFIREKHVKQTMSDETEKTIKKPVKLFNYLGVSFMAMMLVMLNLFTLVGFQISKPHRDDSVFNMISDTQMINNGFRIEEFYSDGVRSYKHDFSGDKKLIYINCSMEKGSGLLTIVGNKNSSDNTEKMVINLKEMKQAQLRDLSHWESDKITGEIIFNKASKIDFIYNFW